MTGDDSLMTSQFKQELFKKQMTIFILSYVANFLILLGFKTEFITVSFFDTADDQNSFLHYPDMQVILLASSFMYFSVGNVLEYTRGCD